MIDFSDPPSARMPEVITFDVRGVPVGQGAHRVSKYGGIYETSKGHATWRQELITMAQSVLPEPWEPILGPVEVAVIFIFPRLQSHYRTGKFANELKPDAPLSHTVGPDLDHLLRTVGDALELARVIKNDAQIACWSASKTYGDLPGASIMITEI